MSNRWTIQGWTTGDLNALVKNLGGEEVARKIQRGEVKVSVEDVLKVLFDKHGRRIPEGLSASVCDANRDFRLDQPKLDAELDYAKRITRLHDCLSVDTKVTAEQLKMETERLLALIRDNSQIANITNGVWLPLVLPKMETDDVGAELERYLKAVSKSYVEAFGDRKFYNYRKGTLANEVSIINGSRHDQLIERMKQGPVIGILFPSPLQGFSINAQREQMATLPEEFILSGLDTVIAMVMYPDVLARDHNTPGLDLSAFSWQSADYSLGFWAYRGTLDSFNTGNLSDARKNYSGGLLFFE
jgi:hypothetical protein